MQLIAFSKTKPMGPAMTLDDFLRNTLREAHEKFPEAGLLIVSVEDDMATDQAEMTVMTNLEDHEIQGVVDVLPDMQIYRVDADRPARLHS